MYLENGATSVGYIGAAKGYNAGFSGTDLIIGGYSNSTIFANSSVERFRIGPSGQWGIGGANYGTAGQVLTSGGSGAAPTWASPSGGVSQARATALAMVFGL
jgi:hypothetical protein